MHTSFEFMRKLVLAYGEACKPLCHELNLTQTGFDILMFLANNPEYTTARDIVEIRKIKANLVSVNVDKLVSEGYLMRRDVIGDRRKTRLICTDKADTIIAKGRRLQQDFFDRLFDNIDEATKAVFTQGIAQMENNLNNILEEN